MRSPAFAVCAALVLLAGCAAPAAPIETSASATDAASARPSVNLTGQVALGHLAAAGVGDVHPGTGVGDAEHCPEATFEVPVDASLLVVELLRYDAAGAEGVANYDLQVTDPEGTTAHMEPMMEQTPFSDGANLRLEVKRPEVGAWTLRAVPLGAAALMTWDVGLTVVAPAEAPFEPATTC